MKVLRVQDAQKTRKISKAALRALLKHLLENLLGLVSYEVAIHLVDAKRMTKINQEFLNHQGSTDVITFDYKEGYEQEKSSIKSSPALLGEIFISVDDAVAQAHQFKTSWQHELTRYAAHGFLHLLGHDDQDPIRRRVMKREENRLMKKLEQQFSIRKVAL